MLTVDSQNLLCGAAVFLKKLMIFLVVVLNTQAKTAKLTTPTFQTFPTSKNFLKNRLLALPGDAVRLQLTHINYANFFLALSKAGGGGVGARAPSAPPGYAYRSESMHADWVVSFTS